MKLDFFFVFFLFLKQILCIGGAAGAGVLAYVGDCVQRLEAGERAGERGRPHHALRFRPLPALLRRSHARQIIVALEQQRGRQRLDDRR